MKNERRKMVEVTEAARKEEWPMSVTQGHQSKIIFYDDFGVGYCCQPEYQVFFKEFIFFVKKNERI